MFVEKAGSFLNIRFILQWKGHIIDKISRDKTGKEHHLEFTINISPKKEAQTTKTENFSAAQGDKLRMRPSFFWGGAFLLKSNCH